MQQVHIQNNFLLFIPISGGDESVFSFSPTTTPHLGLNLTKQDSNERWFYQVQIVLWEGNNEVVVNNCLSWAKRMPYRFQLLPNTTTIEGLLLKLKINPGRFDFRRSKQRVVRFNVTCFNSGTPIGQGTSALCQILPKKRVADTVDTVETEGRLPDFKLIIFIFS